MRNNAATVSLSNALAGLADFRKTLGAPPTKMLPYNLDAGV